MSRRQTTALISLMKSSLELSAGDDYLYSETSIAGNVTTYINNLDKRFRYKLLGIYVYLDTDATAVDRCLSVEKYNLDDVPVFKQFARDVVSANELCHHNVMPGGSSQIVKSTSPLFIDVAVPVNTVLNYGEYISIAFDNGVVGDSYDVRMCFKRIYIPGGVYV